MSVFSGMGGKKIGIIGGGISGLSLAYYLSKRLQPGVASGIAKHAYGEPNKIVLIEQSGRPGGWVHTIKQENQLFELGPRTLRPTGESASATLSLIHSLGLAEDVIAVSKDSPAAQNRFILYNNQVIKMPSGIKGMLFSQSPLVEKLVPALLKEPFIPKTNQQDESVHSFVSRRLPGPLADRMISALIHGIYAGDSKRLSIKSTLSMLWELEREHGSIIKGLVFNSLSKSKPPPNEEPDVLHFIESVRKNNSIYSFKNGMQTLTDTLYQQLKSTPNVEIMLDTECKSISGLEQGRPTVQVSQGEKSISMDMDFVVSAIPASKSLNVLPSSLSKYLELIPSVDVAVVNMAFAGNVLPVQGFGYLVPHTEDTGILGTVFDSCAIPTQQSEPGFTRLTVMMGGHHFQRYFGDPDSVNPQVLLQVALDGLKDHLGITAEPTTHKVSLLRNCIPQYQVGHQGLINEIDQWINTHCADCFALLGASYKGVSVNDCVYSAKLLSDKILSSK